MQLLAVEELSARISAIEVLQDINFGASQGEKLGICGETGSGKSTLLKVIAGLMQAGAGRVVVAGQKVIGPLDQLMPGHPGVVYMSQHFELPNHYTVENILTYESRLSEQDTNRLYRICRIDQLLGRKTSQLSGGERQRISLARALIAQPQLLLLDEPFSNLDYTNRQGMQEVLDELMEVFRLTIVLVSHDSSDLLPWADRILVMKDGQILQADVPAKLYYHPVSVYVAGLFGRYSLVPAAQLGGMNMAAGKQLLVRPGKWKISAKGSISAKVTQARFYGDYTGYVAEADFGKIYLESNIENIEAGTILSLEPDITDPCWL